MLRAEIVAVFCRLIQGEIPSVNNPTSVGLKISWSKVFLSCDVLKHLPRKAVLSASSSEYFCKAELDHCLLGNLYFVCPGGPSRDSLCKAHIPQIKNEREHTKNIKYSQIQQFIFQPAWRKTRPSVFGTGGEYVFIKLIDFLLNLRLWGYSLKSLFCTFGAQHPLQQWFSNGVGGAWEAGQDANVKVYFHWIRVRCITSPSRQRSW